MRSFLPNAYSLVWLACLAFLAPALHAEIGEINVNSGPAPESPVQTPQDKSALWIESEARVILLLIDSQGRQTGVDPKTREVRQQIPNSKCEVDFETNPYTGEQQVGAYERLTIEPAPTGRYQVLLRGLQDGPFEVNISALSREGSSEPSRQLEGIVSEGKKKSFRLTYDSSPNTQLTVLEEP